MKYSPPLIMQSTRLRYLSNNSPDMLAKMIEALPVKVEIKTIALGIDKKWYAWFTIADYDTGDYSQERKKRAK